MPRCRPGPTASGCARLFGPFNRLGQAQGPVEGSGIGLAATHSLVRLMGGHFEAQRTPAGRSGFSVRLPLPAPTPALPGQGTSLP